MQRRGSGRNNFPGFGDPFSEFGNMGGPGSLFSSMFGGSDPFDDPFFNHPFGTMFGPSMFEPSMFGPSMFGLRESPFQRAANAGFLQNQVQQGAPQPSKSKGPIIEEITSEDEDVVGETSGGDSEVKNEGSRKHPRSGKEPYVEDPDEPGEEKKSRHMQMQYQNNYRNASNALPQARTYSFQSSTVTYGGVDGSYYTSSTTRKTGGNGVTVEESKEADTTTGKASHRISRGLHDKGHSVMRMLNSDGRVNTVQTLHNLQEDDLANFDDAWKGNARRHLSGWDQVLDNHRGSKYKRIYVEFLSEVMAAEYRAAIWLYHLQSNIHVTPEVKDLIAEYERPMTDCHVQSHRLSEVLMLQSFTFVALLSTLRV